MEKAESMVKIYKFRELNCKTYDSIENNKIYFSHPSKFNDPFDSHVMSSIKYESVKDFTDKYINHFYKERLEHEKYFKYKYGVPKNGSKDSQDIDFCGIINDSIHYENISLSDIDRFCKSDNGNDLPDNLRNLVNFILRVKIFCASKHYNLPLMWSLYADGYRGICLEIEVDEEKYKVYEIEYNKDKTTINLDDSIESIDIVNQYKYKQKIWGHEEELRIFTFDKDLSERSKAIPLKNGYELKAIHIGAKADIKEVEKQLKKITDVPIYPTNTIYSENGVFIDSEIELESPNLFGSVGLK